MQCTEMMPLHPADELSDMLCFLGAICAMTVVLLPAAIVLLSVGIAVYDVRPRVQIREG